MCCSELQCIAVCCNVLSCSAVRCAVCCSVLQGSAVCSVLQGSAVCCNVLHSVAIYCSVSHCAVPSHVHRDPNVESVPYPNSGKPLSADLGDRYFHKLASPFISYMGWPRLVGSFKS